MKESVFHAENEKPIPDGIQGAKLARAGATLFADDTPVKMQVGG
nr:hypothetical protein [Dinoroseobacter shibae]